MSYTQPPLHDPIEPVIHADCIRLRTGRADECLRFYPALFQLGVCRGEADEERVELGFAGGRLLERLLLEPGAVVSREDLLEHAWPGRVVGQGSLNQQIYTLRQLFCDEKGREIIQTLPRRGYLFNPQFVEESPPTPQPETFAASQPPSGTAAVVGHAPPHRSWLLGAAGFSVLMLAAAVLLLRGMTPGPALYEERIEHGALVLRLQASDSHGLAHLQEQGAQLAERLAAITRSPHDFVMRRDDHHYRLLCRPQAGDQARWLLIHASRLSAIDDETLRGCVP